MNIVILVFMVFTIFIVGLLAAFFWYSYCSLKQTWDEDDDEDDDEGVNVDPPDDDDHPGGSSDVNWDIFDEARNVWDDPSRHKVLALSSSMR